MTFHPDCFVVPLTRGLVAFVDPRDLEWALQWKWHVLSNRRGVLYAARKSASVHGKRDAVLLHREILHRSGTPTSGLWCDHVDGDGLNDRRSNLRPATPVENARNRRRHVTNSSGFKGIYARPRGRWQASIMVNGAPKTIGSFGSKEEAALAYDSAAVHYFGSFARPNLPVTR